MGNRDFQQARSAHETADPTGGTAYQAPTFEVICLACEISAYAPDDETPLF